MFKMEAIGLPLKLKKLADATTTLGTNLKAQTMPNSAFLTGIADAYFKQVISDIYSLGSASPPYNEKYATWKKDTYGNLTPWQLGGDLVNNIRRHIDSGVVKVGVPKGVYDSGGKSWYGKKGKQGGKPKEITRYGYILEFGGTFSGQVHPARPVFTPALKTLAVALPKYNKKYFHQIYRKWEIYRYLR